MKNLYLPVYLTRIAKRKTISLILSLFAFIVGMAPGENMAQTITVTDVSPSTVCAGSAVTITFNVTNGLIFRRINLSYTTSTRYQIFLSNGTGTGFTARGATFTNNSVTYATGSYQTTTGLTQTFIIPAGTPTGNRYRISIGSTNPSFNASGGAGRSPVFTVFAVPARPTISAGGPTVFCEGGGVALTSSLSSTYLWSTGATSRVINATVSGSYTVQVANGGGCLSAPSTARVVTVNPSPTVVSVNGGGASLCASSATLAAANGGSGTIFYQGTVSNGTSTTLGSSPQLVSTAGTYYFRAQSAAGCWGTQGSSVVSFHNVWTGSSGTDWNTAANWSDNQVASNSCPDVTIPAVPNQPILGALAAINNLIITPGASLTVNGTGHLQVAGTITNNGIFDVTAGTLELNGTALQTIAGSMFKDSTLENCIISNNVEVSPAINDTLNIKGTLSFGNAAATLNTGNNITLTSSASGTANIGVMANTNTITGNVTVERFINTGIPHAKTWQLLAIPTWGPQTINAAWQEGAVAPNGDPHPGYGTQITGAGGTAAGFDLATTSPSMKIYNSSTNSYDGVANTQPLPIYNQKGYFVFVRGDRSVTTVNAPANPTILRTTGELFSPSHIPPTTNVADGGFECVGNPYASAIDLRNLTTNANLQSFYSVWDPTLGGTASLYGYGGFQTLYFDGTNYVNLLASPNYGPAGTTNNLIQSGQAFFVEAYGGIGTLDFNENAKSSGSAVFTTPNTLPQAQGKFRVSLNTTNPDRSVSTLDGVLINCNPGYSNALNKFDARKMAYSGENLAILNSGKLLSIESRQKISAKDTITLNLANVKVQDYQLHFEAENLAPGLQAFLADSYLKTLTPINLSGTTDVNFSVVNIPGAYAANRFSIQFIPSEALAVNFTSLKASQQGNTVNLVWTAGNEANVKNYEVERSADGIGFTGIATQVPEANNGGSASYVVTDPHPVTGYNYYRVSSKDINGAITYSDVVKVLFGKLKATISVYPNPVTDGSIHLQLVNEPAGTYGTRLLNNLGQVLVQKQITHTGGTSEEDINWNYHLQHGTYLLEVIHPDGTITNINILF